jgi:hypothetical protein
MGLQHDRGTKNACNNNNYYNFGYRDPDAIIRTIMAYNCRTNQCDNIKYNSCTRNQRFSNPNLTYGGKVPGVAAQTDNARTLNDNKVRVSQYFESVSKSCTDELSNSYTYVNKRGKDKPCKIVNKRLKRKCALGLINKRCKTTVYRISLLFQ